VLTVLPHNRPEEQVIIRDPKADVVLVRQPTAVAKQPSLVEGEILPEADACTHQAVMIFRPHEPEPWFVPDRSHPVALRRCQSAPAPAAAPTASTESGAAQAPSGDPSKNLRDVLLELVQVFDEQGRRSVKGPDDWTVGS
jgi:hypothetical protein